ncbi:MAG: cytochrome c oxidase subunit 3 [Bacteroidia bacterium]|nr:cytochrome c oxidase subunit 3 [Bacteroidia bacterium]MDW8333506.1 cytochrome c oxidase subunit 3 [Bacteroidia bacterium]
MATQTLQAPAADTGVWAGGKRPFGSRYGKLMMWYFLISDAFTFSGLLVGYGMIRYSHSTWADPDKVFSSFPGYDGEAPLVFVGLMTFILIMSSVTMVLAVDAGHRRKNNEVLAYLLLTILGGCAFLGCQAWEWTHLIMGGTTISSNPHGPAVFAQLFFLITGFHGGHVTSGVILLLIIAWKVHKGHYLKSGDYEMVEKIGLYWHFVDLVWVFVFTFFYLV